MTDVLDLVRTKYGGPEGYLMSQCGFSEDDVDRIKVNLVEPPSSG